MANALHEVTGLPFGDDPDGMLVLIVGPSGSGKDTLISWVRERLSADRRFLFVQRTVTRPADVSSEKHLSLDEASFRRACAAGEFSVTWSAHGNCYGLPISALHHVRRGGIAIANGARRALNDIEAVFGSVLVVKVCVDTSVLRERLKNRGRKSDGDIEERLQAAKMPLNSTLPMIEIDNSATVEGAGQVLKTELMRLAENAVLESRVI